MYLNNEDYVAKIANASPLQLVVITYELILRHISEAKVLENLKDAQEAAHKAHQFLESLINALDMDVEISGMLMAFYIHVNKLLVTAQFQFTINNREKGIKLLLEAEEILERLLASWREISKEENTEAAEKVFGNTQQLFAGLTYRNGQLEEYIDTDVNRGFKA